MIEVKELLDTPDLTEEYLNIAEDLSKIAKATFHFIRTNKIWTELLNSDSNITVSELTPTFSFEKLIPVWEKENWLGYWNHRTAMKHVKSVEPKSNPWRRELLSRASHAWSQASNKKFVAKL